MFGRTETMADELLARSPTSTTLRPRLETDQDMPAERNQYERTSITHDKLYFYLYSYPAFYILVQS